MLTRYVKLPALFFCLAGFVCLTGCAGENDRQTYADMIIREVEAFRDREGRLPEALADLDLEELEDSPAYYEKNSDSTYIVWYGLGLGESRTYDSATKLWSESGTASLPYIQK